MKFVIATHNAHKLAELSRILQPLGIEAVTDLDLGLALPEVEETGTTFAENALLKAESACHVTGLPAVADDSGLVVDALGGRPGVYSARYAGENATTEQRNAKLLAEMQSVPESQRTARFVSSVCCVFPDGRRVTAEGTCEGTIGFAPCGKNGFGYDPLFLRDGQSFAELSAEKKDAISHRGIALCRFADRLKELLEASNG